MTAGSAPVLTDAGRQEIARQVAAADGLLLALDFDGTLAPIADDPAAPTIAPTCRRALERLARLSSATVAVISGRELADLRERVGIDGIVYGGNHGLELRVGDRTEVHPLATRSRSAIDRAVAALPARLRGIPGWEIEDKGLTATVHVRDTPAEFVDEVRRAVTAIVREGDRGLRMTSGRQVFEIRPAIDWDKGAAVDYLRDGLSDGWRTMFVGDDVTDEDAFRAIRPEGIGLLVGADRETAATHRLPTQEAVGPLLRWLADDVLQLTPPTHNRRV